MRQLLDQHIRAEDAETLVEASADFSFLDLINDATDTDKTADEAIRQAGGNANGAAEVIEGKARRVNTDWNFGDEEERKAFSERLQALLDQLRESNATAKERIKALIEHIKAIKHWYAPAQRRVAEGHDSPPQPRGFLNGREKESIGGHRA